MENYVSDHLQKNIHLETTAKEYHQNPCPEKLTHILELGTGLVIHYAKQHAGGRILEDLLQAGYEGLIKAAKRFDPLKGAMFSTFATHYIMGEIRHELRREARFDRTDWMVQMQTKVYGVMEELRHTYGQEPTLSEVAQKVNITEEGLAQILLAGTIPSAELDLTRIKSIEYESFQLPLEDKIMLRQAMEKLSVVQKKVIYMTYYKDMNQTQIAEELGINQRQVSRILQKALNNMSVYIT